MQKLKELEYTTVFFSPIIYFLKKKALVQRDKVSASIFFVHLMCNTFGL